MHDSDNTPLRIGPGSDPLDAARREARRADDHARGRALAGRLMVAFLACVAIALACYLLVPAWAGVRVPAWVPLLCFLVIAGATVLTLPPRDNTDAEADAD